MGGKDRAVPGGGPPGGSPDAEGASLLALHHALRHLEGETSRAGMKLTAALLGSAALAVLDEAARSPHGPH